MANIGADVISFESERPVIYNLEELQITLMKVVKLEVMDMEVFILES